MTLRQYLNQELYFSESTQEMLDIDKMAFPHAYYAWRKLVQQVGADIVGTRLNHAFIKRLFPSQEKIADDLRKYGRASYPFVGSTVSSARSRLYRAAKKANLRVTTHREKGWVTAEVHVPKVTVRRG